MVRTKLASFKRVSRHLSKAITRVLIESVAMSETVMCWTVDQATMCPASVRIQCVMSLPSNMVGNPKPEAYTSLGFVHVSFLFIPVPHAIVKFEV